MESLGCSVKGRDLTTPVEGDGLAVVFVKREIL